jgi:tRNA(fMet)-specific endonuclease VapC
VPKTLLDTDIYSEILKGIDPKVVAKANAYRAAYGRYTISVFTVLEVVMGLHKAKRPRRIKQFLAGLSSVEVIPFTLPFAELAGRIDGDLERTGQPIGRIDPMIAAIATHNGWTLVTGNIAHYQRIQSLGYPLLLDSWRV